MSGMLISGKVKIAISILVVLAIAAAVFFGILLNDEQRVFVDDSLKAEVGHQVSYTGFAWFGKGFEFLTTNKTDYCLFLDGDLGDKYLALRGKNITVTGVVEKREYDYGKCSLANPVQVCGKHISYCVKVSGIKT